MALIVSVVLLIGCSGTVPPTEPEPKPNIVEKFVGTWVNINQDLSDGCIIKCKIELVDNSFIIKMWQECGHEDCYWGTLKIDSEEIVDGSIEIEWILGDSKFTQNLTLINDNLEIKTFYYSLANGFTYDCIDILIKVE
jgi:hypothetical protein